jgi:sugar lactone lactonase YvrE/Zn-dependent protease
VIYLNNVENIKAENFETIFNKYYSLFNVKSIFYTLNFIIITCLVLFNLGIPGAAHAQVVTSAVPSTQFMPAPIKLLGSGFNWPCGVAVDSQGNVYVADTNNNAVKRINADGTTTTIGGGFFLPIGVAVDSQGNIYVGDFGNNAVKRIDVNGTITTLGRGFNSPEGVAVDSQGNIYVADYGNNAVKRINADGTTTTLGSGFSFPSAVAVDSQGTIYVADQNNSAVKRINADGTTTSLGRGFNHPAGVAVDSQGNIYVADYGNNAVKRINADGTILTYVVNNSSNTLQTINSNGTITRISIAFNRPIGITVDSLGNIYVADRNNNAIKRMKAPASTNSTNYARKATLIAAAVTAGAGLGILGLFFGRIYDAIVAVLNKVATLLKTYLARLLPIDTVVDFFYGLAKTYSRSVIFKKLARLEGAEARESIPLLSGFSSRELLVIGMASLLLGIAYLISKKMYLLSLENLVLYIFMAGFVLILHDLTHRYYAYKYKAVVEYKFWGLGTVIMFITAFLFGVVFAVPARTIINDAKNISTKEQAVIFLSGPMMSAALAIGFILLVPLGSFLASIALIGVSMNLLTAVYSLMPIDPLDGLKVYVWKKPAWVVVFVPLLLLYVLVTVYLL